MRSSSRARTTVTTGLTAALLPICLAVPSFTGTASAAPATVTPAAAGPAVATTAMRLSAPRGAVAPGAQRIGVRLLANGRFLPGATVDVQRRSGSGWVSAAQATTDGAGHAVVRLPVHGTTAVRAVYRGSTTATAGASPTAKVTVRPAAALRKAAPAATSFRAQAVKVAAAQAGKPYRYGSSGPTSFDCSGLVNYAFRAAGKAVPRTSSALRRATKPVSKAAAVPGDLIFMPGHVGIYAGNGKMIDAPRAGRNVSLRKIYSSRYTVGRIV